MGSEFFVSLNKNIKVFFSILFSESFNWFLSTFGLLTVLISINNSGYCQVCCDIAVPVGCSLQWFLFNCGLLSAQCALQIVCDSEAPHAVCRRVHCDRRCLRGGRMGRGKAVHFLTFACRLRKSQSQLQGVSQAS